MVAQVDSHYIRTRPTRLYSRLLSYALFEGRPLTTRGQWINPMLFAQFALFKRLPKLKTVKAPIFILGTGRSGTTILGIVLSMHQDVGFLNEPKALWHALHPGEDLIGSYSRAPARYRLSAEDVSMTLREGAKRLFGAYLFTSINKRIVDKYPELIFRVPFVKAIFPDARFLFLSRDGWDTCSSIEQWSQRLGQEVAGEVHDWWGVNSRKWLLLVDQIVPEHADLAPHMAMLRNLDDHRARAAVEWIITMREGLRLVREYSHDVMHVPYEAMCIQPEDTMRRIAEFTGLRDDPVYLRYAKDVLIPTTARKPFRLPEYLEAPFAATQAALGHGGRAAA